MKDQKTKQNLETRAREINNKTLNNKEFKNNNIWNPNNVGFFCFQVRTLSTWIKDESFEKNYFILNILVDFYFILNPYT